MKIIFFLNYGSVCRLYGRNKNYRFAGCDSFKGRVNDDNCGEADNNHKKKKKKNKNKKKKKKKKTTNKTTTKQLDEK